MEKFFSHSLKTEVQQINKTKAKKLFEQGKTIYLHPSNLRFDCIWQHPMPCEKNGFSFVGYSFETICADFRYYNCDQERGRYVHFYVTL